MFLIYNAIIIYWMFFPAITGVPQVHTQVSRLNYYYQQPLCFAHHNHKHMWCVMHAGFDLTVRALFSHAAGEALGVSLTLVVGLSSPMPLSSSVRLPAV